MRIALEKIVDINIGYPFRSKIEEVPDGNCLLIQSRNLSDDSAATLGLNDLTRVLVASPSIDKYAVADGDILFMSKGPRNVATLIRGLKKGPLPAIVASSFFILRARTDKILPGFLTWSINQSGGQAFLNSVATGSGLRFIPREALVRMEIDLPDLQTQQRIVHLQELFSEHQRILHQIETKTYEIISAACKDAAKTTHREK